MDNHKTLEQWAEVKNSPAWLVAATKAANGWPVGKELSEAEFDAELERIGNAEILGNPPPMPTPKR